MRISPQRVGRIHMIGIGGIGMSGMAEILHSMGYTVQGSDQKDNANTQRLKEKGITVHIGQKASHIKNAKVIALSSAVTDKNPEVIAARQAGIPIIRRVEMLAEIMAMKPSIAVSGSHGKTTTTSLTAAALDHIGLNPTVISGGIMKSYGTNAKLGTGSWMLVEADESDGTFTGIPAQIGVITNIDAEHLDHYGNFAVLQQAFLTFVEQLPFYGLGLISADCDVCERLFHNFTKRKLLSFGTNHKADICGKIIETQQQQITYEVTFSEKACTHWDLAPQDPIKIDLPLHGNHNMHNSLASIGIALECGATLADLPGIFQHFKGVDRRFTITGKSAGITVVDDYAHHPEEIEKVADAAHLLTTGRVFLVVQPHRFSRLQDLMDRYATVLSQRGPVFLTPVFAAGEEPLPKIDNHTLATKIKALGNAQVTCINDLDALATHIQQHGKEGDIVLCMGAGDITKWAHQLPKMLAQSLQNNNNNMRSSTPTSHRRAIG